MAVGRKVIFPLFKCVYLGGAFWGNHLKTQIEVPDLAEFLIFFTKKAPDNIAAFGLKIGRINAPLQPFKLTDCWNLDRLLWPPWRWCHTYGMVCLAHQKWMLKLEFLAHFRICGRAFTHVSAELFKFEIGCFYKKLRPSEDWSFWRFLHAHSWEEPFHIFVWKTG